jgi:hypothetical protein
VVWGFGKLLNYLRRYITTSLFIQTDKKDGLIRSLENVHQQLLDAEIRAGGHVPMTPEKEKTWKDGINKQRGERGETALK